MPLREGQTSDARSDIHFADFSKACEVEKKIFGKLRSAAFESYSQCRER